MGRSQVSYITRVKTPSRSSPVASRLQAQLPPARDSLRTKAAGPSGKGLAGVVSRGWEPAAPSFTLFPRAPRIDACVSSSARASQGTAGGRQGHSPAGIPPLGACQPPALVSECGEQAEWPWAAASGQADVEGALSPVPSLPQQAHVPLRLGYQPCGLPLADSGCSRQ